MNWSGLAIAVGLVGLAFSTMPYGIAILAGMAWAFSRLEKNHCAASYYVEYKLETREQIYD